MEVPRISGTDTGYGIGSLRHDRDRQGKRSFEQDFEKAGKNRDDDEESRSQSAGVASHNTEADPAKRSLPTGLQDRGGIIRKDEQDGQLHVDVVI